ncbi:MAG: 2TM domain-containing protein [Alphaproteobacteria bacterium]
MIHHLKNEKDVQGYVRYLKNFYGEFSLYILVITLSLIVWLLMGGGYFWPLWIILIWGVILLLKASRLHIINPFIYQSAHGFREKLPFIRPEWQEEKAQEILKKLGYLPVQSKTAKVSSSSASKKKASPAKKAAPKSVKSAPKKVVKKTTKGKTKKK